MKKAIFKNPAVKTFLTLGIISVVSLAGFSAAFGYGGGGGYVTGGGSVVTTAPSITAVNMPLSINNTQSGILSQAFSDGSGANVTVPTGAISGQTTFTAQQGSTGAGNVPTNTTGAVMIGGQVFNINAADLNGQAVRTFSQPLTITLTVPNMPADTADLGVYYYDDAAGAWITIPGAVFNAATKTVTFSVNHLTKFAIFKSGGSVASIPTTPSGAVTPQVLGVKAYGDGVLLRAPDLKIYAIRNSAKHHVLDLIELRNFFAWKTYNVAFDVIAQYPNENGGKVLGVKAYGDGVLLRTPDLRIYAIVNGSKVYISSLDELKAYSTWKMYYVSLATIAQY